MKKINYWIVGAFFENGTIDMYDEFIIRGYWYLGWEVKSPETKNVNEFIDRANAIKVNDRLAIKQLLGKGSKNILIKAIGIVTSIDKSEKMIYVNWICKNMNREVPIKGFIGSIYGPYTLEQDQWIGQYFSI